MQNLRAVLRALLDEFEALDKRGTVGAMTTMQNDPSKPETIVDVRGPSGRLYGRLDREKMILEVKRKGEQSERIDLKPLLPKRLTERGE